MRNTERLYHENKHDLRKSWKIMKEIIGNKVTLIKTILNV